MKNINRLMQFVLLITTLSMAACGGGGNDGNSDNPDTRSHWGVMHWDRDTWARE